MNTFNPRDLELGRILIKKKDGTFITGDLLANDTIEGTLRLEIDEGIFEQVSYEEVQFAA